MSDLEGSGTATFEATNWLMDIFIEDDDGLKTDFLSAVSLMCLN